MDNRSPKPTEVKSSFSRACLCLALAGLLLAPTTSALGQGTGATLTAGSNSGLPGAVGVPVSVSLASQSGTQVASIQFDLNFPSTHLSATSVNPGSAAAGKTFESTISSDRVRVIIYGGSAAIPDGALATISFTVDPAAPAGTVSLSLSNAVAASPSAQPVSLTLVNGSFTVLAPPATNTPVPTATRTSTRTPTRTPTRTSTPTSSFTPGPSPTPSRTFTPGPTSTPAPPTSTPNPTATGVLLTPVIATGTAGLTGIPSVTSDLSSPKTTGSPAETETPNGFETAVAATGTALADLEAAVAATSTALAVGQAPRPGPGPGLGIRLSLVLAGLAAAAIVLALGLAIVLRIRASRRIRRPQTPTRPS